jgi:hypothetical protein
VLHRHRTPVSPQRILAPHCPFSGAVRFTDQRFVALDLGTIKYVASREEFSSLTN